MNLAQSTSVGSRTAWPLCMFTHLTILYGARVCENLLLITSRLLLIRTGNLIPTSRKMRTPYAYEFTSSSSLLTRRSTRRIRTADAHPTAWHQSSNGTELRARGRVLKQTPHTAVVRARGGTALLRAPLLDARRQ